MNLMIRPFLGAAIAAALLTPATAVAAPHWSSPVQVAPPGAGTTGISTPKAFVTPDGRSLAVFADGLHPSIATGDVQGRFGAPSALGRDEAGSSGVDAALGADGTLAVAWVASGAAHVTVVPPGQGPRPQVDLAGAGVNSIAVAVGADGTVTVAYRTKSTGYAAMAATAPPGGAFGDPVQLDTSSGGIDAIDAAAGPGGAVAVVYRKLAPRYRTNAVVKPAGAAAFGSPQALSPSSAQADTQPQVAFQHGRHDRRRMDEPRRRPVRRACPRSHDVLRAGAPRPGG